MAGDDHASVVLKAFVSIYGWGLFKPRRPEFNFCMVAPVTWTVLAAVLCDSKLACGGGRGAIVGAVLLLLHAYAPATAYALHLARSREAEPPLRL